jgi:hypothetical protein
MARLRIAGNRNAPERVSRAVRTKRRGLVLLVSLTIAGGLLLAYQAITSIVEGDHVMHENYMGQPVGPGLQLAVVAAVLVAGIVAAWQYFHPKSRSTGKKKGKSKPFYGRWPYDIP